MTQPPLAPQQPAATAYAGWGARLGALILDSVPNAVVLGVLTAAFGDNQTTGSTLSFSLTGLPFGALGQRVELEARLHIHAQALERANARSGRIHAAHVNDAVPSRWRLPSGNAKALRAAKGVVGQR